MQKEQVATGVKYAELTEAQWQRGIDFLRTNRHDIGFSWEDTDRTWLTIEEGTDQQIRDFEAVIRG